MVLTSYPTRTFPETRHAEDTTLRTYTGDTTWASCTNTAVSPGSDQLVHFRVKSQIYDPSYAVSGYVFVWKWRVKDGTTVVWSSPVHSYTAPAGSGWYSPTETDDGYAFLTAGSHTLYLEYAYYKGGTASAIQLQETEWRVGELDLKNLTSETETFSAVSCPNATMTTVLNAASITVPASSSLFYGSIKAFNIFCIGYMIPDTATSCSFVDAGDKYVASQLSYFIEFGSTPWDWSVKNNESTYGVDMKGATSFCGYSAAPSESLTLTVKCYNATGTARTLSGNFAILISPWITTYNHHAPWSIPDLPLGSTVYFTIDPEAGDSDTEIYAGAHKRVIEFDTTDVTANDFIGIDNETSGVKTLSYSFDKATPDQIDVMARSKMGVINRITLDIV